jgi:hypothetical protein
VRRLLLALYPASWRTRYGEEFEQVLLDRPLGPFDVADILLGALDAHLHLRGLGAASQHGKGFAMSLRIGGWAAIIGGALWLGGLAAASADDSDSPWPWTGVLLAGTAALLVALVGLSAFQARRHPRLVWAAFAIPAVGVLLSIVGMTAMAIRGDLPLFRGVSNWDIWILGTLLMVVGSGLFAVASWRTGTVSRAGSALLGIAAVAVVVAVPGLAGLVSWEPVVSIAFLALLLGFTAGWILLGIGALRADRSIPSTLQGAT